MHNGYAVCIRVNKDKKTVAYLHTGTVGLIIFEDINFGGFSKFCFKKFCGKISRLWATRNFFTAQPAHLANTW